MYYIDIDWNELFVYEGQKIIHREAAMILRDLKTEKLLFIGDEAKKHLSDDINLLSIVPVEGLQVTSIDDLNLLLEYVIKKLNLKNSNFINRYELIDKEIKAKVGLIKAIDFIKTISTKDVYVEVRNLETNIYDLVSQKENRLDKGITDVLRSLNSYFYLNKNGLLNSAKTLKLFNDLCEKQKIDLEVKEIGTGKNLLVKDFDLKLLLNYTKDFYQNILSLVQNANFDFNQNVSKLKSLYD